MNKLYVMLAVMLPLHLETELGHRLEKLDRELDERGGGNQSGENLILLAGAVALAIAVVALIAVYVKKKAGSLP